MAKRDPATTKVNIDGQEFMIAPSSAGEARIHRLGLAEKGSEDVSHLLVVPPNLPQRKFDEERDYRPVDAIEWVVDIAFDGDPILQVSQIREVFNTEWLSTNGEPDLYGWSPEIDRWTYLISADSPKIFTKLAFGWDLYRSIEETYRLSAEQMEGFRRATEEKAGIIGKPTVKLNRTPAEAAALAASIREVVARCNRYAVIVLKAPKGKKFAGKNVWDVMMCLGLTWGDMDTFHWNSNSRLGDDSFFSVETTTPPGYFLPEKIAAGQIQVDDLIFVFSIPRSAAPLEVLDSMLKAVSYAKERLGGEMQDRDGNPIDETQMKTNVKEVLNELTRAGFKPGESATLRVF
jgi:cell division protein ZipA